jgi:hypothetical protein
MLRSRDEPAPHARSPRPPVAVSGRRHSRITRGIGYYPCYSFPRQMDGGSLVSARLPRRGLKPMIPALERHRPKRGRPFSAGARHCQLQKVERGVGWMDSCRRLAALRTYWKHAHAFRRIAAILWCINVYFMIIYGTRHSSTLLHCREGVPIAAGSGRWVTGVEGGPPRKWP